MPLHLTLTLGTCFCNAPLLSALPVPLLRQFFLGPWRSLFRVCFWCCFFEGPGGIFLPPWLRFGVILVSFWVTFWCLFGGWRYKLILMPLSSENILFEVLEGPSSALFGDLFQVLLLGGTFSHFCVFYASLGHHWVPKWDPLGHPGGSIWGELATQGRLGHPGEPKAAKRKHQQHTLRKKGNINSTLLGLFCAIIWYILGTWQQQYGDSFLRLLDTILKYSMHLFKF